MDYNQAKFDAKIKVKNATDKEKYDILRNGTELEKIVAIGKFNSAIITDQDILDKGIADILMKTLRDESATVRKEALVRIRENKEYNHLAGRCKNITELVKDASPDVRQEVTKLIGNFFYWLEHGENVMLSICSTAYWEFLRATKKLAKDPVPKVADSAKQVLEEYYKGYSQKLELDDAIQPTKDYTQSLGKDKGGMDI